MHVGSFQVLFKNLDRLQPVILRLFDSPNILPASLFPVQKRLIFLAQPGRGQLSLPPSSLLPTTSATRS